MSKETKTAAATELWPQPIPIIGGTGDYESGKTIFGVTISPRATRLYDMEKSSESYLSLGFRRIDVAAEMLKQKPDGYKPIDTFEWWWRDIKAIKPGHYDVIGLDPASEIESGAVDWVRKNPQYFGRTLAQYMKMEGLMWGDMKELWKAILSDLASRCKTFYFTVHLGNIWADNRPTGKKKPKGKSTLMELASLFLHFDRKADAKGSKPKAPAANVLKSRLAHTRIDPKTGEITIVPMLPPRLPVATPAAIRQYMLTPPDYAKLSEAERTQAETVTDDDRMAARQATAEAEADSERYKLARMEREDQLAKEKAERRELAAQRRGEAPAATQGTTTPPATPQNGQANNGQPAAPSAASTAPPTITEPDRKVNEKELRDIADARGRWFGGIGTTGKEEQAIAWKALLRPLGVETARELTKVQGIALLNEMTLQVNAAFTERQKQTAAATPTGQPDQTLQEALAATTQPAVDFHHKTGAHAAKGAADAAK